MFKRFKLKPRHSVNIPLPEGFQNTILESPLADEVFLKDFEYKAKVGSLLYFMICMRPDIAFYIGLVARYSNRPTKAACAAVTQLLQFVYNTRHVKLVLGGVNADLTGFCDSELGGCKSTRKSTGGYAVFLGYGIIDWSSRLQNTVALNVFEAEYMTMSELVKSLLYLRWLLYQTRIERVVTKFSSTIYCDNMAAISLASNPSTTKRSKHISIRYHMVRDLVAAGVFCIEHIATDENVADIFTKAVGRVKFQKFASMLLGYIPFQVPNLRVKTKESKTKEYV